MTKTLTIGLDPILPFEDYTEVYEDFMTKNADRIKELAKIDFYDALAENLTQFKQHIQTTKEWVSRFDLLARYALLGVFKDTNKCLVEAHAINNTPKDQVSHVHFVRMCLLHKSMFATLVAVHLTMQTSDNANKDYHEAHRVTYEDIHAAIGKYYETVQTAIDNKKSMIVMTEGGVEKALENKDFKELCMMSERTNKFVALVQGISKSPHIKIAATRNAYLGLITLAFAGFVKRMAKGVSVVDMDTLLDRLETTTTMAMGMILTVNKEVIGNHEYIPFKLQK